MKPASEDLLKGLLKITQAVMGIVALLFVGTGVAIYLLVVDATPPVADGPTVVEEVSAEVAPATTEATPPDVVDGKDVQTGLLDGEGLLAVKANCLSCHSAELVIQNRFTREGWYEKSSGCKKHRACGT